MRGSPRTCGSPWIPCASGGAGSPSAAWMGWPTCPAPGGRGGSASWTRAAVVALACQLPAATGIPLSRWTGPELAGRGHQRRGGRRAVGILGAADPGRAPGQALAVPVVDLPRATRTSPPGHGHPRPVPGLLPRPAAAAPATASCPSTPSRQSRPVAAAAPPLPPRPAGPCAYEHEYQRKGALALLAALDVRTGKVFASTAATTGIAPFMDLLGQVMASRRTRTRPGYSSSWVRHEAHCCIARAAGRDERRYLWI